MELLFCLTHSLFIYLFYLSYIQVKRLESEMAVRHHEDNKAKRSDLVDFNINPTGNTCLVKLIQMLAEEKKLSQQRDQSKDRIEEEMHVLEKKIEE